MDWSLAGISHEIIVADDDSPDLTWLRAQEVANSNSRVRVLRRARDRGLAPAAVEAFGEARVACIDADLQHDPSILPAMLERLENGHDLVIGSRYCRGGGVSNWGRLRRLISCLARRPAQIFVGRTVRDPLSGYFMLRRKNFLAVRNELNPEGFKILLEVIAKVRPKRLIEVPFTFGPRTGGKSKVSAPVIFSYLRQLWRLSRNGSRLSPMRLGAGRSLLLNMRVAKRWLTTAARGAKQ